MKGFVLTLLRPATAPAAVIHIGMMTLFASLVLDVSALDSECASVPVSDLYKQSSHVFLAEILSTDILGNDEHPDVNKGRVSHRFRVLETFKGQVDYDSFETGVPRNKDAAFFDVGDVNLFFMGEIPGFNECRPRFLLGQDDTRVALGQLRDLRAGTVSHISGAWSVRSGPGYCSISTTYSVPDTSGSLSLSFQFKEAEGEKPSYSSIWLYSHARRAGDVVNSSGLELATPDRTVSIPYSTSATERAANFYSIVDGSESLLSAILAESNVRLSASTRNNKVIDLPVLLSGGAGALREYAMCSNLVLTDEQSRTNGNR